MAEALYFHLYFKVFYLFTLLEREEGREETAMCERCMDQLSLTHPQEGTGPTNQACALTGNGTGNPWVHRLPFDPLNHTSQGVLAPFK